MHVRRLLLALALMGCRSPEPAGTVFYASGADLQSINPLLTTQPLARQLQRYVLFTTLVRYDSALAPMPYLARSWAWSDAHRTLTFVLQPGVRWHDGVRTTAADVKFTLEAAKDPTTGYPRSGELECLANIDAPRHRGTEAPDTVRLTFCKPQERIPDVLFDLAILPAHLLAGLPHAALRSATFNEHPVGNGPFRFVAHESGRRWVFEANKDFPAALGGPPATQRFVIVIVDESTTKLAALVDGELDVAGINPMHAAVVRRIAKRAVLSYPILFTYGVVWNTSRAPWDDPRLRRALTLALDRRQMVDAFIWGFGEVADGPVPSWHPLAASVPHIPFDRAASGALLDSLGWRVSPSGVRERGGRQLALTLTTVGSSDNVLEQLIQADFAAVGVRADIRQLELGAFLAEAEGGARDYDALVTGIPGDPALGYLGALFDSRRLEGPMQYARYRNAEVDRALDAGDLAAVQRLAARDLPISFLFHTRGVQGLNTRVHGVRMDLRGELATVAAWHLGARN
ncbi:MAG: ABC transporter substrate-binding protein [Gemmatimonadales bacterium]